MVQASRSGGLQGLLGLDILQAAVPPAWWGVESQEETLTCQGHLPAPTRLAPPLSYEDELWLVTAILLEIGKHYGVNLNTSPSFEHRVGDSSTPGLEKLFWLVLHTCVQQQNTCLNVFP